MKIVFSVIFIICAFFSVNAQTYFSEEVCCSSDSITLCGTLTYPDSIGRFPAVIIISGTGKQDRDGTFANHRPFYEIANYLTPLGFAVLRMDDREVGESGGNYDVATTRDFANDVLSEIDLLKSKSMIDTSRIGLIGHSEGGAVAFMLAAESPDVSFVVSLAGLAIDGYQSLILQNRALLESSPDIEQSLVEAYMNLYTLMFKVVKDTPIDVDVEPELRTTFQNWLEEQSDDELKKMNMNYGHDQMFLSRYLRMAKRDWYRQMINYSPDLYLNKITVPVLALNGDKDLMVTPTENLSSIEKGLEKAGNKNYKTVLLKNHNHMFQRCEKCTQQEIRSLPESISLETLTIIADWLLGLED